MVSKLKVEHLAEGVDLWLGDCLQVLPALKANSIDAVVTDPPYHLQSIYKRFAARGRDETSERYAAGPYGRHATGFMGKKWDGGDIAFRPELWRGVYRVLKPGGHLLSFGGTRTYDLMCYAVRQAGFEIRDCIMWVFGSGFPKSHSVSKVIDRAAGAEREIVGPDPNWRERVHTDAVYNGGQSRPEYLTAPATEEAKQWGGWGTALKPACEPIVLARKPLSEASVAANVLKWGTGALNIDGTRIGVGDDKGVWPLTKRRHDVAYTLQPVETDLAKGRWPANVIHDGSEEVVSAFPDQVSGGTPPSRPRDKTRNAYGKFDGQENPNGIGSTAGSAARFFYSAKADSKQRFQSKHPTVKPLDLMAYLCRLVTPPNGLVLDPFAGSGTTAIACLLEGFHCLTVEREAEYAADIRRRIKYADEEIASIEKQPAFFKELIPKPKAKGFFK